MKLGTIVSNLRKERNIGQKELAAYLHVSVSTICNYENGVHFPDPEQLCKIADFFDVSVDYLLGRSTYRDTSAFMKEYSRRDSALFEIIQAYFRLSPLSKKILRALSVFLVQYNLNDKI